MEIPRYWRLKAQRYRLEGSTCPICGQLIFPPRPICSHCAAQPVHIANAMTMALDISGEKEAFSVWQVSGTPS
jgi:uncharacterized OB-fold protein